MQGSTAIVPTFRPDLEREIDLVEEVARRVGLDNITRSVPASPEKIGGLTPNQRDRRTLDDVLVGARLRRGLHTPVAGPIRPDECRYRDRRAHRGREPLAGRGIDPPAGAAAGTAAFGRVQRRARGHLMSRCSRTEPSSRRRPPGRRCPPNTARSRSPARTRSGARRTNPIGRSTSTTRPRCLQAIAQELRIADLRLEAVAAPGFHPTRAARILVDGREVGVIGEVASTVIDALSLAAPVVACEIAVDAILASTRTERMSSPVSRFPASTIDLAFVVDDNIPAAAVRTALVGAGRRPPRARGVVRRLPFGRARPGEGEPRVLAPLPARPTAPSPTTK